MSGIAIFDLERIDAGHLLVTRISVEFAPWSALASPSVCKGRYFSFEKPAVTLGSKEPPSVTIRNDSEVFVVDRLPKK